MSAKRKSSKRSVTSNTSPPDNPPLFIDRDAWSKALGAALVGANVDHVAHHQHFKPDSPDVEWIQAVSGQGWIAITRDQNIRRKPNELAALRQSRAVVFVFTSGNLSAGLTAAILLKALPRIYRKARDTKRPALYSIRVDGTVGNLGL